MKFSPKEIEHILKLYPFAKKKVKQPYTKNTNFINLHSFYSSAILLVEKWVSLLDNDEQRLIIDRCFKNKSFEKIAIQSFYANHSSIVRKYNKILQKISQFDI